MKTNKIAKDAAKMFIPGELTIFSLAFFLLSCIYLLAASADEQPQPSFLAESFSKLARDLADKSGNEERQIINPVRIIVRFLRFYISFVTFPIRFNFRVYATLLAVLGLLLQGCRVVPELSCSNDIMARVPDFINTLQEEMEFDEKMGE